ncbi:MAG TPA: hypothetical protein VF584_11235 [Longimicrobium sp.]
MWRRMLCGVLMAGASAGCAKGEGADPGAQRAEAAPSQPSALDSAVVRLSNGTQTDRDFAALEQAALRGDYQAQRNLAWWLSDSTTPGHSPRVGRNQLLACAWRMVILRSGSMSVDRSDAANMEIDCGQRLSLAELSAATAQAERLYERIYPSREGGGVQGP